MVSSVSRSGLWVGGLASGLDTQSIIDQLMRLEHQPVDHLERKRTTLGFQRSMLQEVNLKLFELQNRATDLTFTRTFNTKVVTSTDKRLVTAEAATNASVGQYTVRVKQIATATKAYASSQLVRPIERGQYLQSLRSVGGGQLTLDQLGISVGSVQFEIEGETTEAVDLAGITGASTLEDAVRALDTAMAGKTSLNGKVKARYNRATDQVEFHLLDSGKTITVKEGTGNLITQLFGGNRKLDRNAPVQRSAVTFRSGGETLLSDLGLGGGVAMTLEHGGHPAVNFSLSGDMSVAEAVAELNRQIDQSPTLVNGGTPTGRPADRKVEFRFDRGTGKLMLANLDTASAEAFILRDVTGNFTQSLFGATAMASNRDDGQALIQENFGIKVSSGSFTIDGVQIQVNANVDTLRDVLARINNATSLQATYDGARDVIRLARRDGRNEPIGLGSAADTSNFLSATRLLSGNQQTAATLTGGAIGSVSLANARDLAIGDVGLGLTTPVTPGVGRIEVSVGGVAHQVTYDTATDSLTDVLDRIAALDGIDAAWFDATTGKVSVTSTARGASATVGLRDVTGNLVAALQFGSGAASASGANVGGVLESSQHMADLQVRTGLVSAGFLEAVIPGSFTINGVKFNVTSTSMSLQDVIDSINSNDRAGVYAEYDTYNGRFMLTAKSTGNTAIAVGAAADTSNLLAVLGLDRPTQEIGQNAIFSVDGLFGGTDLVRQSNEVKDAISGVTLSLRGTTTGAGETLTITADTEKSKKAIDDFLKSYNEVMDLIYDRVSEERKKDDNGKPLTALTEAEKKAMSKEQVKEYEDLFKIGLLNGDSMLNTIRTRMRVTVSAIVPGLEKMLGSLASIGISTGTVGSAYQETERGRLAITDSEKLMTALQTQPDKVADLFGKDAPATSAMGIARRLKTVVNEFTKSDGMLTRRVGRSGVASSNSEMDRQISLINSQIARQEDVLQRRENSLIRQFADLEKSLSKYQSQSQAFSQQLAQLAK